jgi:membrane protein implicated in regulation of membrane protease activity
MSYSPEWILAGFVTLIAFLCAPPLALLAFGVLVLAVLAALLALAVAIVASPYLLFRHVQRRWAPADARRRSAASARRALPPKHGARMFGAHGEYIH